MKTRHGFESEWEGEAVSKTTTDPETPIFGELSSELGLPEIDVHDFEAHDFGFPKMPSTGEEADTAGVNDPGESTEAAGTDGTETTKTDDVEAGKAASTTESAHAQEAKTEKTPVASGGKRGGRRRKAE